MAASRLGGVAGISLGHAALFAAVTAPTATPAVCFFHWIRLEARSAVRPDWHSIQTPALPQKLDGESQACLGLLHEEITVARVHCGRM